MLICFSHKRGSKLRKLSQISRKADDPKVPEIPKTKSCISGSMAFFIHSDTPLFKILCELNCIG